MFTFITSIFFLFVAFESVVTIKVLNMGILPIKSESAGIFFYINVQNESPIEMYHISSLTEQCCLRVDLNEDDCSSMDLIGGDLGFIRSQEKKSLILVNPTTFPHDKIGSCVVSLLAKLDRSPNITKLQLRIPFDTRILGPNSRSVRKVLFKDYLSNQTPQRCLSPDDDSVNDCKPVQCDLKYNGKRPFFDSRIRRCVRSVTCIRDPANAHEELVYVPSANVCRNLKQPITADDLNLINFGTKTTTLNPQIAVEHKVEAKFACNCSSISQYLQYLVDIMFNGNGLDSYKDCSKEATAAMIAFGVLLITACWQLSFCVGAMLLAIRLREMCIDGSMKKKTSSLIIHLRNLKARTQDTESNNATNEEEEAQYLMFKEFRSRGPKPAIRQSVSDLCERMSQEVSKSKRYRPNDVGSQFSMVERKTKVEGSVGKPPTT